jgi:hypothetical protein
MKIQIAACICIALTHPCLGDETLFTCRDAIQQIYTAEGGQQKPGWSTDKWPADRVVKLIQLDAAKRGSAFDIQGITQYGKRSFLESCAIKRVWGSDLLSLDQAFVVTCEADPSISTFLFYTRSGAHQLLETHLTFSHSFTNATVIATKDCKKGD